MYINCGVVDFGFHKPDCIERWVLDQWLLQACIAQVRRVDDSIAPGQSIQVLGCRFWGVQKSTCATCAYTLHALKSVQHSYRYPPPTPQHMHTHTPSVQPHLLRNILHTARTTIPPSPSPLQDALSSLQFKTFAASLCIFHTSEFLLAYIYMRDQLSWRSWLISRDYILALSAGVVEFFIEWYCWPTLKRSLIPWALGMLLITTGEALRKTGMLTAQHNFTHAVQFRRRPNHRLITHGVYAYERHPGYVGWLLWAVGTQFLLGNAIAVVVFYLIATRFFRLRVAVEEEHLIDFFGREFVLYRSTVPTRLPGVD